MTSIAVMVPTYRRPSDLARCLAGLRAQTEPPSAIVVTVRRDDLETKALLAEADDANLRYVELDVPGVVQAMNCGLAAIHCDVVAITDDDAVPRPDWLERLRRHFEAEPGVAGVGGRDVIPEIEAAGIAREPVVGIVPAFGKMTGNHHVGIGEARDVDVLKGVNSAYRVAAVRPIGFDERLLGSGAQVHWELSLCLALRARGYRLVYDPDLVVDHYVAARLDDDRRHRPSWSAMRNVAYNEHVVRLPYQTLWQAVASIAFSLAIGTRATPGFVQLLRSTLEGRLPPVLAAFTASAAGVLLATVDHLRTSAPARAGSPRPGACR